jgi:hypothetical protein
MLFTESIDARTDMEMSFWAALRSLRMRHEWSLVKGANGNGVSFVLFDSHRSRIGNIRSMLVAEAVEKYSVQVAPVELFATFRAGHFVLTFFVFILVVSFFRSIHPCKYLTLRGSR